MFCHLQFSALLIIIFIMELAAGIAGYVYKSKVSIWSLLCTLLKSPEHSLCIKIGNKSEVSPQKTKYNVMIKHKLKVPCASFEENCAQTRTFSYTPLNTKGNHLQNLDLWCPMTMYPHNVPVLITPVTHYIRMNLKQFTVQSQKDDSWN